MLSRSRSLWPIACAAAFVLLMLSGCLGGGGSSTQGPATGEDGSSSPATSNTPGADPGQPPMEEENKAHDHNYWGTGPDARQEVHIFWDEVPLQTFPLDGLTYEGCNSIGFAEFGPEDDANDVNPGDRPVNPDPSGGGPPRADTVFPGTFKLIVKITWTNQDLPNGEMIPGLTFQYRPANVASYRDETTSPSLNGNGTQCGIYVPNGQEFEISVQRSWFDPAHQVALSRWKFRLWAADPANGISAGPYTLPAVGLGSVFVEIRAINGGVAYLDPPHPDFFAEGPTRDLGTSTGSYNLRPVLVPSLPEQVPHIVSSPFSPDPEDTITLPAGSIVPLFTTTLDVVACFEPASDPPPPPSAQYLLAFHGAGGDDWHVVQPVDTKDGCPFYIIEDPDGEQSDSPYEFVSQWGFRIVPVTADQHDMGYFKGTYEFHFVAHADIQE